MKKSISKPILIFLLSVLLLTTLVVFASAEGDVTIVNSGTCGSNLTWTLDSAGTLTISGSGSMSAYDSIKDNGIYRTSAPWGTYYKTMQVVVLDEGVTSIGRFAFYNCTSLTSVTIPDSVTSIDRYAFSRCTSLTNVTIPNSVTSIGHYAFSECSSLTSVTIGDSVTSIGNCAFYDCTSLTSVTIPDSVTSIGGSAFSRCTALTSVTISNSVTSTGNNAFYNCTSLTSVTIGNSVTSIGDHAFDNCASLTSVTIPDSVTSIGYAAFEYCTSLTSVTIPDSVTSIGSWAFWACTALTSVTIPDSVTSIGNYAFCKCTSLTSVTIPNSVTSIGGSAFSRCTALTSVTIGNSVTSIDNYAFYNCTALKDVYYTGSQEQWQRISIGSDNAPLKNATIHYNYATSHFPAGYDFERDSYDFVNDLSVDISQKYFDGIFEAGTASLAHSEYHDAGALCYGMAFTTASIYNGYPGISRWAYRKGVSSSEIATKIRDLKRDTWWGVQSAAYIGGDYSDCLTLLDYFKYAFIFQYSVEASQKLHNSSNNALELLSLVKQYTDAGLMGIAVGFTRFSGHDNAPGGHEVLAIGYDGNDILIDNPNNSNSFERMTVHDDGSWEFGGYNNNDHWLDWDLATYRPYTVLLTGNRIVADVSTANSRNERYVLGTEKLNSDYNLVSISSSNYSIENTDYITLPENSKAGTSSEARNTMLWVKEGTFKVDDLGNDVNTVICAGDNSVITTTSSAGSAVSIDVKTNEAKIETEAGNEASISLKTVIEGDLEDTEISIELEGTSTADEILVTQTDADITVTGLNDINITYSKNDEVVAEATVSVTDGREVNITVNEDTEQVTTDFQPHEHSYTAVVTQNPTCTETGVATYTCTCGESYTETIPTLGHTDADSNGNCTRCGTHIKDVTPQTNSNACRWCGKVHNGNFFDKLTGFFHKILAIFKR